MVAASKQPPRVTIGLPVRNGIRFLEERVDSIQTQTFPDWEVVAVDGLSTDGTWERLQAWAKTEPRVRCEQQPPCGVYHAFNRCAELARGEYVYIATSDDTMEPDCLAKLVAALTEHPDCGLAHCCLTFIDEAGTPIREGHCWENWATTRFFADSLKTSHVRERAHDAVVAMALGSVYYSVTQLLIRRSLLRNLEGFRSDLGSFGDWEWQMRASLLTKTVHVPEYLATWRLHSGQASQLEQSREAVLRGQFVALVDGVIKYSQTHGLPWPGGLPTRLRRFFWNQHSKAHLASRKSRLSRLRYMFARALGSDFLEVMRYYRDALAQRFFGVDTSAAAEAHRELCRLRIAVVSNGTVSSAKLHEDRRLAQPT